MHDAEPLPQRLVRVFKDGAGDVREAVARLVAGVALPLVRHRLNRMIGAGIAARAENAFRSAMLDQVGQVGGAGFLMRKSGFPLWDGHLMDSPLLIRTAPKGG